MVETTIDDDALGWAIRVADPEFSDWDGFTAWLEGDVAHAARYDAAVLALAQAERDVAATPVVVAEPAEPAARRDWYSPRWAGGAIAAALVAAVGVGFWSERAQPYVVETAAGQQRTVALADGSEIVVAGGSRVELDHARPRFAAVTRGETLFRVRHDAAHPFQVKAGTLEMTDLGTVFNVKRAGAVTRVAVSEGVVLVDPKGAALRLDPGQAVIASGARLQRETVDTASVGGWRDGWLAYDGATLTEVAEDLSRQIARPVTVAPELAGRTFRGTLDARRIAREPALLGSLLGVRVQAHDGGWILEPHS